MTLKAELKLREDPSKRAMARKPANERSSERVHIGAPATLKWGDEELTGFVEVVNTNGMFVAAPRAPEIGDYVELVFSLPGDRRSFRVRGNVVFAGQPECRRHHRGSHQDQQDATDHEAPPSALRPMSRRTWTPSNWMASTPA